MKPTTLVVFDFDYTLYRSPLPPLPSNIWWMSPRSLAEAGLPGFDPLWILSTVQAVRAAYGRDGVQVALLTGRSDLPPLRKALLDLLKKAGLYFHLVSLKPVRFPALQQAAYKAAMAQRWILAEPSIRKVILYDDEEPVLLAVGDVVRGLQREFQGVKLDEAPSELGGLL